MNNPEILTSEERDENTERKRELIELVASGEAVLIVGAGSSRRVSHPDWTGLLEALEDLATKCGDGFKPNAENRVKDLLAYTEDIKSHIRNKEGDLGRYHHLLYELFRPKTPAFDDLHKILVSLPFRGILTTNYDSVLEAALGEIEPSSAYDNSLVIDDDSAGRVHEFLMAMIDRCMPRRIAHLHGRYDYPRDIILSTKDYEKAYGLVGYEDTPELNNTQKISDLKGPSANQVQSNSEWTLHRKLLWAVLATRRVVFVGFSMDDPYFEAVLDAVSTDLWRWGKSIHFAIMSISRESATGSKNKAERLKSKYGVDTVFYEDFDESHRGLDRIVNDIDEECRGEQLTIISQEQVGDDDRSEDDKPKPVEGESQEVLDWLEQMTEDMKRRIVNEN